MKKIIKKSFANIFKKDEEQIAKLVNPSLFSESDYHLARIFEHLGKVKKRKAYQYLDVFRIFITYRI